MGFVPFVDDNPYAGELSELRDIAKAAKFDLEFKSIEESDSDVDEKDASYLKDVEKKVIGLYEQRSSLLDQKAVCEGGIEKIFAL